MKNRSDCGVDARCPNRPLTPGIDRRMLLRAGAAQSVTVMSLPFSCGQTPGSPPSGPIAAGDLSHVPVRSLLVFDNAVLGRDADGLYAMSAVCTHAGGPLVDAGATAAAGLVCPWHGSRFDANGVVTQGPARSSLQHFQVDLASDGAITIQGAIPVTSDARTPAA